MLSLILWPKPALSTRPEQRITLIIIRASYNAPVNGASTFEGKPSNQTDWSSDNNCTALLLCGSPIAGVVSGSYLPWSGGFCSAVRPCVGYINIELIQFRTTVLSITSQQPCHKPVILRNLQFQFCVMQNLLLNYANLSIWGSQKPSTLFVHLMPTLFFCTIAYSVSLSC